MVHFKKTKRSEPKVGERLFNPLQKERLTSHIYGLTSAGKKTPAKAILQDASVQRRVEQVKKRSQAEAQTLWLEILAKNP